MLDIKQIRKDPAGIKVQISRRKPEFAALIDEVIALDLKYREALTSKENLEAERNKLSKEVGQFKAQGKHAEAEQVIERLNKIKAELLVLNEWEPELSAKVTAILESVPNLPDPSVPVGEDETENREVDTWCPARFSHKSAGQNDSKNISQTPMLPAFQVLSHEDIGVKLGLFDFERGVKIAQSRFTLVTGMGAKLERALINFMLDRATEAGYSETVPPILVNSASMYGTGQLPKFREDLYKIEGDDLFLIPTAEVPLTNIYRDEILREDQLPVYLCAYTPCFRSESGSAGKDTRGIIRLHQFNKIELVKICTPDTSAEEHEQLTLNAEALLKALELPYRKLLLCTGDMGFGAAKCYDLEVWFPSQNKYREISSCSNFSDFQARRAQIRYKTSGGKNELVHTINGSGLAVGRTLAAILENYQNADGTVNIPAALIPYMAGVTKIEPSREAALS